MTTLRVSSERMFNAYLIASFAFIASILLLFWVFRRNADHVTKALKNPSITDPLLRNLDRLAFICFMIGVLSLSYIGVVSGRDQIKKETDMAKAKEGTPMGVTRGTRQGGVDPERQQNSLEGIGQLNPKPVPDVRPKPIEPAKPTTTQTGGSGLEKK